jgi:hypothetical protein
VTAAEIIYAIKLGQYTNVELLAIELAIDETRRTYLSTQMQYARELGHLPVRP